MSKNYIFLLLILALVCNLNTSALFAATLPLQKTADLDVERFATLKAKEQDLKVREESLQKKETELNALQKDVDARISKLQTVQNEVNAALAEFKVVQSKNFKNLIKVYSVMSASKLAPLLNDMNDEDVTKILRAMKTNLVAKVMPKLKQQKAVAVSKRLGMMAAK